MVFIQYQWGCPRQSGEKQLHPAVFFNIFESFLKAKTSVVVYTEGTHGQLQQASFTEVQ